MPRQIGSRTSLKNLKREAKRWLRFLHAQDPQAHARLLALLPTASTSPTLRDVQLALAHEYGFSTWEALRDTLARNATLREYEKVVEALSSAYASGDATAMRTVRDHFGHRRTWDALRRYVRIDLGKSENLAL